MERIEVALEAFKGPLDLLLHLIEKNEIDIYDIPIASITDQYMEYLDAYAGDMENISAFLVMAATLLEIKSRMLLPLPAGDEDGEDPRAELVDRLVEYKRYLSVLELLREQEKLGVRHAYRQREQALINAIKSEKRCDLSGLLGGVTIDGLQAVFNDTLKRKALKTDVVRSGFSSIKKETYTIAGKMAYVLDILTLRGKTDFFELFGEFSSRIEKVVTFLAILELTRQKKVNLRQRKAFGAIEIEPSD